MDCQFNSEQKLLSHSHPFETAVFVIAGRARAYFGPNDEQGVDVEAGDFLSIPADLPHGTANIEDTPVQYVLARAAPGDGASRSSELIHPLPVVSDPPAPQSRTRRIRTDLAFAGNACHASTPAARGRFRFGWCPVASAKRPSCAFGGPGTTGRKNCY